jgi:hypothetical protein
LLSVTKSAHAFVLRAATTARNAGKHRETKRLSFEMPAGALAA